MSDLVDAVTVPKTAAVEAPEGEALRTHPLGFLVGAVSGFKNAVLPIVAVLYSMRDQPYAVPAALGIGVLIVALNGGVEYLKWRKLTYRLGDSDIRVESGILSRSARSVPYERIQDVSLEQALLPRLFGLVVVKFETGAGGKDELKLAFLSEAEGERLREVVRVRKDDEAAPAAGQIPGQAAGEDDSANVASAENNSPPIFAMNPARVFTFGLFEFSLAIVAVAFGLAQQFDFLLPFDIWEMEEWQSRFGTPDDWLGGFGPVAQIAGIILAVGGLAIFGVATGLIRTTLREWGFTLDRTAKGFRRRRGLLTRTDVVMPVHRVQALVIGTKMIRRRFGWHSLSFVSLAQDSGSSSHVVAPFAKMDEIEPVARESGFALPGENVRWFRASKNFRIDRAVIWSVVLTLVTIGAVFTPQPALALIPLGAIPLIALIEWKRWRFSEYAADTHQLYTREKWLAPRRKIAARMKLHSAEISRGPIAQRRGYATLRLGLAGGSLSMRGLPLQRAEALRTAVLDSIAATDFSQLEGARPVPSAA